MKEAKNRKKCVEESLQREEENFQKSIINVLRERRYNNGKKKNKMPLNKIHRKKDS